MVGAGASVVDELLCVAVGCINKDVTNATATHEQVLSLLFGFKDISENRRLCMFFPAGLIGSLSIIQKMKIMFPLE